MRQIGTCDLIIRVKFVGLKSTWIIHPATLRLLGEVRESLYDCEKCGKMALISTSIRNDATIQSLVHDQMTYAMAQLAWTSISRNPMIG
jgi:hypothetical protein